jgi:hypothetical protein
MNNDLAAYIERLELIGFFAGYPLDYAITRFIAGRPLKKIGTIPGKLKKLLPLSYALTGTLYAGLILRNIFPDITFNNIAAQFPGPYLKLWGLLSVLFWFPVFRKKQYFSLLHSLLFFFLLFKDLFIDIYSYGGADAVKNDMKLYTDSLLLNTATLLFVTLISFLHGRLRTGNRFSV